MADIPTLEELLQIYTVEQLAQIIIGVYQAAGFPTSSWQPFGTERTRLTSVATAGNLVSAVYTPRLAASGFVTLANNTPGAEAWVPLTADQVYDIQPLPAQPTIGYMQLTNSSQTPYNIAAGAMIVLFQLTGNRYTNLDAISIPANTQISAEVNALFQSSGTGSQYNDPASQGGTSDDGYYYENTGNLTLVTPFPGIGINNSPQTSVGSHNGPSQGTIELSLPADPLNSYIIVKILVSGNESDGSAYFSYSLNGSTFSGAIQMSSPYTIAGTGGIDLVFTDAGGTNPSSFYSGDSWTFNVPGDWKIQSGTDVETNNSIVQRSLLQWNKNSGIPTLGFYESLIRNTPNVGNQIEAVIITADPSVGGRVLACISGPDGYLSPQVLQAVQSYADKYTPITQSIVIFPPDVAIIDFSGTITVAPSVSNNPVTPLPQIQQLVQVVLSEYIENVKINGTIYLSTIVELIKEQTGIIDVDLTTLSIIVDSIPQSGNYTLGSSSVYVQAVAISTTFQFNWVIQSV